MLTPPTRFLIAIIPNGRKQRRPRGGLQAYPAAIVCLSVQNCNFKVFLGRKRVPDFLVHNIPQLNSIDIEEQDMLNVINKLKCSLSFSF